MEDLSTLLNQLEDTSKLANKEVDEFPVATRAGWASAINNAKGQLVNLKNQYNSLVQKRVQVLAVTGGNDTQAQKFLSLAEKHGLLVVDLSELYRNYSTSIFQSLGKSSNYGIDQHFLLCQLVRETVSSLGLEGASDPELVSQALTQSLPELTNVVRNVVRSTNSDTINQAYVNNKIFNHCLTNKFNSDRLVVVFINGSDSEVANLSKTYGGLSKVNLSNKKVSEEYLEKVMTGSV